MQIIQKKYPLRLQVFEGVKEYIETDSYFEGSKVSLDQPKIRTKTIMHKEAVNDFSYTNPC